MTGTGKTPRSSRPKSQAGTAPAPRRSLLFAAATALAVALVLHVCAIGGAGAAAAETSGESPPVVVVFDSSGSMWGELADNPQPKFALARRALRENLGTIANRRPTGLVVFGRSCTTAALESPLASRSVDALLVPVDNLNPRGKGPLTLALENALSAFPAGAKGDIVVVHDGNDNCGRDPCGFAERVAATNPGLRLHLLSVGLSREDAAATRCIAERTGGMIVAADDAPAIATGMADIAALIGRGGSRDPDVNASSADAARNGGTTAAPSPAERQLREDERPGGPARIVATASLGPSGAEVSAPVAWTIRRTGSSPDAEPLLTRETARLVEPLPPGAYELTARLAGMSQTREVVIEETGPTRTRIPFDAGALTVEPAPLTDQDGLLVSFTRATEDGSSGSGAAESDIATRASGETADDRRRSRAPARQDTRFDGPILIEAGRYWVEARVGHAVERRLVTIERGSDQTLTPFAGHGLLELTIIEPAAGAQRRETPISVLVEADAPERPEGRRVVARTTSPASRHVLPAGTYYVTLEVGRRRTSQLVAVPAGRRVSRTFELQAAVLKARMTLIPGGMSLRRGTPLTYAVEDLAAPGAPAIAWSGDPEPVFHLAAGRYRIIARIGAHNVLATTDVALDAGKVEDIALTAAAAEVRLAIDGDTASGERLWEVRTAGGDVVWRTNNADPKALLAPGRYVVRCITGSRILEGTFNAEAGSAQTVALVAE